MPEQQIEPFRRKLDNEQEPSNHQRKFLYLPLATLRDFTNIRSIVIKYNRKSDGKLMKNIEIQQKIKKLHTQMGMLETWNDLHLDELEFIRSDSEQLDASIWSHPKITSEAKRDEIHRKLSEHQKQFTYLPYHIFKQATNIVKLVRGELKIGEKHVDYVIGQIHEQMAIQCVKWIPQLASLRFVESFEDDQAIFDNKNVPNKTRGKEHTSHKPSAATATSKSTKNVFKAPQQLSRELRNLQSDLVINTDESARKKSENNAIKKLGNGKDGSTPMESTSKTIENRIITKRMSISNLIHQTPERSTCELRKRKSDVNLFEDESPKKRANNLGQKKSNKLQAKLTTEPSSSKVPEIIRSPKKVPAGTATDTSEYMTHRTRLEMSDLNYGREELSTEKRNHSGRQQTDIPQSKLKVVQSALPTWPRKIRKPSEQNDEFIKLPKRQANSKPSAPQTTSRTLNSNRTNTNVTVRRDVDDVINEAVIILSDSSNNTNFVNNQTPADDYDQPEDELNQLSERHDCNADQILRWQACSPSDFQRHVLELSYKDFISKTNIRELVLKEHRKLKNDEHAVLSDSQMQQCLEFCYEYRKRTQEWHLNCIKNLKFTNCERTQNMVDQLNHSRFEPNDANNIEDEKSNTKDQIREISEFQREIMALSYEEFINQTNIKEIVAEKYRKQTNGRIEMTKKDMKIGLNHYDNLRNKPSKWPKTELIHLKFKLCDCKRKKQFKERSVATDVIETREFEVQCDLVDFDANRNCESAQQQLQLADLAVHQVHESQIICILNVTSEASESNLERETNTKNSEGDDDKKPIGSQNTIKMLSQNTSHSKGESHYKSSQSVATSRKEVSDIFAMVPSKQILSVAEFRISEFIEGSAPTQNVNLLVTNPLETKSVFQAISATMTVPNEEQHETKTSTQVSKQFEPQQNLTPMSSLRNIENTNDALQSQKVSEIPSSSTTITFNIKSEIEAERYKHLSEDSDLLCLGEPSPEVIDVSSEDLSTEELFLQVKIS